MLLESITTKITLCIVILTILFIGKSNAVAPCIFSLVSTAGTTYNYDFSMLNNKQTQSCPDSGGNTYEFQYCTNYICGSSSSSYADCQQDSNQAYHGIGDWTQATSQWSFLDPNNPTQGLLLKLTGGTAGGDGCQTTNKNRESSVTFQCKAGADGLTMQSCTEDSSMHCNYVLTIPSSIACGSTAPPPPPPGGSDDKHGLSGGSIFLIIFFVLIPVYIALGCLYQRKKNGTTSMADSCPNYEFWSSLPGYIKEGFVFSKNKIFEWIARCRGQSSDQSGYEAVK